MLSPRECEVMQLLAGGLTLKEIATELGISVQTASKHRSNLFEKLRISNEVELLKLLFKIDPVHALDSAAETWRPAEDDSLTGAYKRARIA